MSHKLLVLLTSAAVVAGCASHPDPIVDMQGVNPESFAQDWRDCESYSEEVSIGKGIAKGAATGGGVGAVGGAIGGDSGDVAKGAATGALIGGTRSGLNEDRVKQNVFKRCLRGRGYRVLN